MYLQQTEEWRDEKPYLYETFDFTPLNADVDNNRLLVKKFKLGDIEVKKDMFVYDSAENKEEAYKAAITSIEIMGSTTTAAKVNITLQFSMEPADAASMRAELKKDKFNLEIDESNEDQVLKEDMLAGPVIKIDGWKLSYDISRSGLASDFNFNMKASSSSESEDKYNVYELTLFNVQLNKETVDFASVSEKTCITTRRLWKKV
jgi:hypothetical protein